MILKDSDCESSQSCPLIELDICIRILLACWIVQEPSACPFTRARVNPKILRLLICLIFCIKS